MPLRRAIQMGLPLTLALWLLLAGPQMIVAVRVCRGAGAAHQRLVADRGMGPRCRGGGRGCAPPRLCLVGCSQSGSTAAMHGVKRAFDGR